MTLEERIKALMEAKSEQAEELLSEESIEELEEAKIKMEKDGAVEVDSDDDKDGDKGEPDGDEDGQDTDDDGDGKDDADDEGDDDKTDYSKDSGKKNAVDVKEGVTPGQGDMIKNGGDEAGGAKTSKLKTGLGKKESSGSLKDTASADKQEDNGDNSRLKVGLGKKESTSKLAGPSAGTGANPDQDRNNAGTGLQKGAKVNEHMSALFQGEELSEEFQKKASTIFEAAVESVAQDRIDELVEEYAQQVVSLKEEMEQQLDEAVEEVKSDLVENIDGYLNFVVEQWMNENQVALEGGIKVDVVNSFIDGLKTLFKEHYINIPEDKLDIIEEQSSEIDELANVVSSLADENESIKEELTTLKSKLVFESVAHDLTVKQSEKFKELVENVEFTTEEEYEEKLETLKESYFPVSASSTQLTESIEVPVQSDVMSRYVDAIGKNVKF